LLCHGLVERDSKTTAWLIAHDGALPLVDSIASSLPLGRLHRYGWQECDELVRTAPVIISAGCSTGRSHFSVSNEVLGLYSVLRSTGTSVLVAPQWDIEPGQSLPVLADALTRWFGGETLVSALHAASLEAFRGIAARHAWAFAIEGGRS
jgi:hypothetical protein